MQSYKKIKGAKMNEMLEFEKSLTKEFKKNVSSALNMIKSIIDGQVNPVLEKYKNEYGLNLSDEVIEEIIKVLKV